MAERPLDLPAGVAHVFNRFLLPKVAFAAISLASLAGAALTGLRQGWVGWPVLGLRWLAYWLLALLLGAALWRALYLAPSLAQRPAPGAVAYAKAMLDRYRAWQKVLLPLALAAVAGLLILYGRTLAPGWEGPRPAGAVPGLPAGGSGAPPSVQTLIWAATAALVALTTGCLWSWRQPAAPQRPGTAGWLTVAGAAGAAAALAVLDVLWQGGGPLLAAVRVAHVWAFAAWLGGAFWNIFIAVPVGLHHTHLEGVILAHFQLERFRAVVRGVFATLIATGLVQTWAIFGWQWRSLATNLWGFLVLAKVGLIAGLVVVFIVCPMWRACSPVRGVCDLDDLE